MHPYLKIGFLIFKTKNESSIRVKNSNRDPHLNYEVLMATASLCVLYMIRLKKKNFYCHCDDHDLADGRSNLLY